MSQNQKSQDDVVIVDGIRTPFAKSDTKLKTVHPAELGRIALKQLIEKTNLDVKVVDEVIIGNTGSPSDAVNISRVVALNAGIPQSVPAYTVHRNCASAMESIADAYDRIKAGQNEVVIAGGTESMSQMPMIFSQEFVRIFSQLGGARTTTQRLAAIGSLLKADVQQVIELVTTGAMQSAPHKPRIAIIEGLTDPFVGKNMGETAELIAKEFHITREEQDAFALLSHQKAVAAQKNGILAQEITPVFLPPKFTEVVSEDVGPRESQSLEALKKLKPIFDRRNGTVTAGNACPITDGAAMLLIMKRSKAESLGYKPIAKIRGYAFAGLEPERMGLGPVYATPRALKRAGLTMKDIGLVELNEAFAAQVLSCMKAFSSDEFAQKKLDLPTKVGDIDPAILNVNGGAIALGHPVGATGTRLVLTLMKEMQRRKIQFGLATLCIGGGQGGAMIIENEG
jgi:acetyl-CoA acyltransferase